MTRAFYRGYVTDRRRAGQVMRLHIERLAARKPRVSAGRLFSSESGKYAWCGIQSGTVTRSAAVWFDPMPTHPPEGLTWCPNCIGHLAEELGQLGQVARILAEVAGR